MVVRLEEGEVRIGILSGYYPGLRFESPINHKLYADYHGYSYIYNFTPECDQRKYFFKIETIRRYIDLFDWIFWIDDDAYFTDFSIPLTRFLEGVTDEQMVICASPSTKKLFTKFSAGQFLLKSTDMSRQFIQAIFDVDMEVVRNFWRDDLGYYSHGDQEAMVYLTETDPRFSSSFIKIVDHNQFNNRDFEYQSRLDEHFLVHFTGRQKQQSHQEFYERLAVNRWLVPDELVRRYTLEGN